MKLPLTKAGLGVALSRLQGFDTPQIGLEQYKTEPDIAADLLWTAFMQGDIEGRKVADLGTGTGILGIGALILGAKEVIFVESESSALHIAKTNHTLSNEQFGLAGSARFIQGNVNQFIEEVYCVVQNPPFGTKQAHADKTFLEAALKTAKVVYTLHKTSTEPFIRAITHDYGFISQIFGRYRYPLPPTMPHHKRQRQVIEVSFFQLKKK